MGTLRQVVGNTDISRLYKWTYGVRPFYHEDKVFIENLYDIISELLKYSNGDYILSFKKGKYYIECLLLNSENLKLEDSVTFLKKDELSNKEKIIKFISPYLFFIVKPTHEDLMDIIKDFNRNRNLSKVLDQSLFSTNV